MITAAGNWDGLMMVGVWAWAAVVTAATLRRAARIDRGADEQQDPYDWEREGL